MKFFVLKFIYNRFKEDLLMSKNWIRILSIALMSAMVLPLFACTGGGTVNESESESESISEEQSAPDEGESQTPAGTTKETDSSESDESVEKEESSDKDEQTTEEKEEETVMENVYGYDFTDSTWSSLFAMGGGATREIAVDPAGSGEAVLAMTHNESQTASWIKNKNNFENTTSGKVTISVDLYIPSDALQGADDYVQMQINGEYNHHCNLVSDAKANPGAFDTQDFPRDKWFKVQFVFDMDVKRYNLVVVEDGQIRTTIFSGRAASNLDESGPTVLRVFLSGADQTVYVDHMGLVTTRVVENGNKPEDKPIYADGVSFLRIEGVNVAGEKLSVYGDFTGNADANSLTNITWEKSATYSGSYSAISGADGLDYTPANGGYYLRVKAKYGAKTLTSYPVFVRASADAGFIEPYLSVDGNNINAAIVYNSESPAAEATVEVKVYDGSRVVNTFTEGFTLKQASDVNFFAFSADSLSGKRVVLTVKADGREICSTEAISDMPLTKLRKTTSGSSVYIGNKIIADFAQNRYMRFRSTTANDHWIGTEHNPIDMGFAYQESGVAGLYNTAVDFTAVPGAFRIVFTGQKAGLKTEQRNELIGFWNVAKQEFSFIYNCSMTADSESWHNNSSWASSGRIEPFDYHLERMSILDRVYNKNQNGDLYDYVIYENGGELIRIPKLPVPRTAISGKYFYGFFLSPGESVYYPDPVEGGWKSTILSDSGDTYVEICWSWYDIHSCSENSVPKLGNCEEFTVSQSWLFATTTAEHDSALIGDAAEVDWKDLPNYQLPLFSTNNTFETQFGGTDWQYAWWKSSYDCTMDAAVGHNGAGSVKIQNITTGETSWYTEGVWGFPYSFDDVRGKTYRVSGYIKTENVVGEAYIANIQYQHATPADNTVNRSEGVSGTTDWTFVTFTFTAQERVMANGNKQNCIDHFFLTLNGTGTVWFDDVVIEEVK